MRSHCFWCIKAFVLGKLFVLLKSAAERMREKWRDQKWWSGVERGWRGLTCIFLKFWLFESWRRRVVGAGTLSKQNLISGHTLVAVLAFRWKPNSSVCPLSCLADRPWYVFNSCVFQYEFSTVASMSPHYVLLGNTTSFYILLLSDQISRSVVSNSFRPMNRSTPGLPV